MRQLVILGIALVLIANCFVHDSAAQRKPQAPIWEFRDDVLESTWARVLVSKTHVGDSVVYRYRILNGGYGLSALVIGLDAFKQRVELPVEMREVSCGGPWDWICERNLAPDGEHVYFLWQSINGWNLIQPSQEMSCFTLTLPKEEPLLERGHWTAYTNLHVPPRFSGGLRIDTERPPVQVLVEKRHRPEGTVEYRYQVMNGSAYPITSLWLGMEEHCTDRGEIRFPGGNDPPVTPESPVGWTFHATRTEEDSLGSVSWLIDEESNELMGGMELHDFSLVLPAEDPIFESGHWQVVLNSGQRSIYEGILRPDEGSRPPVSSLFGQSDVRLESEPGKLSVTLHVPIAGPTTVELLDQEGRKVSRVFQKNLESGETSFVWDGTLGGIVWPPEWDGARSKEKVGNGSYFLHVTTPITERFVRVTWHK